MTGPMVRGKRRAARHNSLVSETITPPSTSPCPARYLVALWTDDARAQFQRPDEHGRGESVVDDQRHVRGAAQRGDFIQLRTRAAGDW